jgi:hypothetical protein
MMYYYQFTLNKTKTMIIRLLFWIPPTFIYNLIRYIFRFIKTKSGLNRCPDDILRFIKTKSGLNRCPEDIDS